MTQRHYEAHDNEPHIEPSNFDITGELQEVITDLTGLNSEFIKMIQKTLAEIDAFSRSEPRSRQKLAEATQRQRDFVESIKPLVKKGVTVEPWQDLSRTVKFSPTPTVREDVLAGTTSLGDKRESVITISADRLEIELPQIEAQVIIQNSGETQISSVHVKRGELLAPEINFDHYSGLESVISLRNSDRTDNGGRALSGAFNSSQELGTWARYDFKGNLLTLNVQTGKRSERFHRRFRVTNNGLELSEPLSAEDQARWSSVSVETSDKEIAITKNGRTHTYPRQLPPIDLANQVKTKILGIHGW